MNILSIQASMSIDAYVQRLGPVHHHGTARRGHLTTRCWAGSFGHTLLEVFFVGCMTLIHRRWHWMLLIPGMSRTMSSHGMRSPACEWSSTRHASCMSSSADHCFMCPAIHRGHRPSYATSRVGLAQTIHLNRIYALCKYMLYKLCLVSSHIRVTACHVFHIFDAHRLSSVYIRSTTLYMYRFDTRLQFTSDT